jgi:hypothetical protein
MTETKQCHHARGQARSMACKRWVSQGLVAFFVSEGNYRNAAELASGFADLFRSYSQQILDLRVCVDKYPMRASFMVELQQLLETVRAEISCHQQWTQDVLTSLSDTENAAQLRAAFDTASIARLKLAQEADTADHKYLLSATVQAQENQLATAIRKETQACLN